jgi:hypothetical protein
MHCHALLALLFEHGPLRWSELCAYLGLDDDSRRSPAWEPLEHLMELGLVRCALMGVEYADPKNNVYKYRATCWRNQPRKKAA